MRFCGEEMVFHRLEIRCKTTNVAEIESKSITGSVKTSSEGQSNLGTFVVPSPEGNSEAWRGLGFLNFDLKRVLKCKV